MPLDRKYWGYIIKLSHQRKISIFFKIIPRIEKCFPDFFRSYRYDRRNIQEFSVLSQTPAFCLLIKLGRENILFAFSLFADRESDRHCHFQNWHNKK